MNPLMYNGAWNEVQGKLKQKYGQLTDDDLAYAEGKYDELVGSLQKKLGRAQDEIQRIIHDILATVDCSKYEQNGRRTCGSRTRPINDFPILHEVK